MTIREGLVRARVRGRKALRYDTGPMRASARERATKYLQGIISA